MRDGSFKVDRGADQSIIFQIFTNESLVARLNVSGKPVRAYIRPSESVPPILSKLCREINGANGEVALDLTPAESRLIPEGRKVLIELKVFDGTQQFIVARGVVTGLGGVTLDTNA